MLFIVFLLFFTYFTYLNKVVQKAQVTNLLLVLIPLYNLLDERNVIKKNNRTTTTQLNSKT